MTILADWQIRDLCNNQEMISPFEPTCVSKVTVDRYKEAGRIGRVEQEEVGILSYGLSSYGYDIRLSRKDLKVFKNDPSQIIDPRRLSERNYFVPDIFTEADGLEYIILPPNSGMLGHTPEYFKMPRDILAICMSKSTYVRSLVSILVTPLEPSWEGQLVVEIVNHTGSQVMIYLDQGIGQLVFHNAAQQCETSYADRKGKYQGQTGTQDAKV